MTVARPGGVRMEGVGLRYRIYHDRSVTLRETMLNLFGRRSSSEWFTALSGLDLAIEPGESVALIGANGAGKSSTLKLLAGVYQPSEGVVETGGRTASLLDLGVGFHPELTGEENVMLNGALIGLDRRETGELVPGIAEFAELTRFMDTPVKYYSAGMFMRLGFSLATSVSPDILLVDEVLAVGDASFQEKCYDRIAGYREGGGTIVFVSHDMEAARRLCSRCVWLDSGRVRMDGPVEEVVSEYLSGVQRRLASAEAATPREWGSRKLAFGEVTVRNREGVPTRIFRRGETIVVDCILESRLPSPAEGVVLGFSLHRPDGERVMGTNNLEMNRPLLTVRDGTRVRLRVDLDVREPGTYLMGLALTDPAAGRDYHWQDYMYPVTLLEERRDPPFRLERVEWEPC